MEWKTGILSFKEIKELIERKNPEDYAKLILPSTKEDEKYRVVD
ncbi:hypothetical protein [Clostridium botulinum]|nr:hypothetical protein [Clostridium botulinum]